MYNAFYIGEDLITSIQSFAKNNRTISIQNRIVLAWINFNFIIVWLIKTQHTVFELTSCTRPVICDTVRYIMVVSI